ncbi:MAG: Hpt domain-containing protein [Hyphomicrobiaceae bacterium]|nr:Hpt domain-containing protein [Hyphomicrobiaceae bacterium]
MDCKHKNAGLEATEGGTAGEPAMAIDLDYLARYTLGNQALQEEVLGLFRDQSGTYLRKLGEAGDAKAWADAAHTLKGSARSVGATGVAQGAEAAEALAGNPDDDQHREALRELAALVDQANRSITRMLGAPSEDA